MGVVECKMVFGGVKDKVREGVGLRSVMYVKANLIRPKR